MKHPDLRRRIPNAAALLFTACAASAIAQSQRAQAQAAQAQAAQAQPAQAQPAQSQEKTTSPVTSQLPLRDVVIFSSGVGYFGRVGRISGESAIPLSFRADQVNDILKSLVLFDPNGEVRPVTYGTRDSLARRLSANGLSPGGNATLGELLRGFQGARVSVSVRTSQDNQLQTVQGRIISVSTRQVPQKDGGVIAIETLNILVDGEDGGLRSFPLDAVAEVTLRDKKLNAQLSESLGLLAGASDERKRAVELRFGAGREREVRAGYLLETPVWKTSYRLVLDRTGKEKPYLQGWGIVENQTDEDWTNVRLSLVSGRPISFVQDLYAPLYVPRPVVAPQIIASPQSQTYGESTTTALADASSPAAGNGSAYALKSDIPTGGPVSARSAGASRARRGESAAEDEDSRRDMAASAIQMAKTASQAQGAQRGELFEYAIKGLVTLPRGQASMVPIVSEPIGGDAVSIYDADSDEDFALNGFRLKNTSGLHLAGGPITVFQDGVYAGDAQINNLGPNEDRLISYAVDLDVVASRKEPTFDQETLSVSAREGVLLLLRRARRTHEYSFRNKSKMPKTVLVQQNLEADWKLVEPKKASETTAEEYRFTVAVVPGKTSVLRVVEERPIEEKLALFDADFNVLVAYARNAQVSPQLRAALEQLVARRRKVNDLRAQRVALEEELKTIAEEQGRIRQNMEQLDHNNALYKQYVAKLTAQETRVERVRELIARLRDQENAAQKELRAFVDKLSVD